MSDLIDRSKLPTMRIEIRERIDDNTCHILEAVIQGVKHAIDSAPRVDAVEVIRCKDCVYWGRSPFDHASIGWCIIAGHHRNPDYYCASADAKNDPNR